MKDGESIAVHYLSKSLVRQGVEMDLLSVNTPKHFFEYDPQSGILPHYQSIDTVFINTNVYPWGAFKNLFSRQSYHISRFIAHQFKRRLKRQLQEKEYDFILLESIFVAPYTKVIRKYSNAKILLRAHNIEFLIWDRVVHQMKLSPKALYLKYLTGKLKRYELEIIHQVEGLIPISHVDASFFVNKGFKRPIFTFPVVLDAIHKTHRLPSSMESTKVTFLGSLDWVPNQEGLYWFVQEVWPLVCKEIPDAVFEIAGRHLMPEISKLASDSIKIIGEVEDAQAFFHSGAVNIVPLFSGSGMRVKIIECMALGPIIVSTTIGAEGINVQSGEHLFIADTPEDFAQRIITVLKNPSKYDDMSIKARKFIEDAHDTDVMGRQLMTWINENF